MQEIAIIELVQYETETTTYKPSHAGIRTPIETLNDIEKHYKLKFSSNTQEYDFSKWIKEKGGHYEWLDSAKEIQDNRFYPRASDDTDSSEHYHCICQALTHFLLENNFKLHSVNNILHIFTKDV